MVPFGLLHICFRLNSLTRPSSIQPTKMMRMSNIIYKQVKQLRWRETSVVICADFSCRLTWANIYKFELMDLSLKDNTWSNGCTFNCDIVPRFYQRRGESRTLRKFHLGRKLIKNFNTVLFKLHTKLITWDQIIHPQVRKKSLMLKQKVGGFFSSFYMSGWRGRHK